LGAKRISNIWQNEEALIIQDFIISEYLKTVTDQQKLPIIMHLPVEKEISAFKKNHSLPASVLHTEEFCRSKKAICWFPLKDRSLWKGKTESFFGSGFHYSAKGNEVIARFVKSRLEKLKQGPRWSGLMTKGATN
jgi:lysophospholipase L1-like esterase